MSNLVDEIGNDWLYNMPGLYEKLFSHDEFLFELTWCYLNSNSRQQLHNVLELGCGTGRNLQALSTSITECVGIDLASEMLSYGKRQYPDINLIEHDIRTIHLHKTFDLILCIGSVLMHAEDNNDLDKYLWAMAKHSHPGTQLFITFLNKEQVLQSLKTNNFEYNHKVHYQGRVLSIHEKFTLIDDANILLRKTISGLEKTLTSATSSHLFTEQEILSSLSKIGFSWHDTEVNISENCKQLAAFNTCIHATYRGVTYED